jgi:hypothetical protein
MDYDSALDSVHGLLNIMIYEYQWGQDSSEAKKDNEVVTEKARGSLCTFLGNPYMRENSHH